MSGYARCFHCLKLGHWHDDCPLLEAPQTKAEHEARLAEFKLRLGDQEIGPIAKRKMIETENSLWRKRQREMARQ